MSEKSDVPCGIRATRASVWNDGAGCVMAHGTEGAMGSIAAITRPVGWLESVASTALLRHDWGLASPPDTQSPSHPPASFA